MRAKIVIPTLMIAAALSATALSAFASNSDKLRMPFSLINVSDKVRIPKAQKFFEGKNQVSPIEEKDQEVVNDLVIQKASVLEAIKRTNDVKLRNILAREALPDLLLIRNRCH